MLTDTLDSRTEGLSVLFGYNPSLTRIGAYEGKEKL
jgi:hypothetical protein